MYILIIIPCTKTESTWCLSSVMREEGLSPSKQHKTNSAAVAFIPKQEQDPSSLGHTINSLISENLSEDVMHNVGCNANNRRIPYFFIKFAEY